MSGYPGAAPLRVCLDYRPALHESTGVGAYVRGLLHGLADGCPDDRLIAFSASWKHRLDAGALPGSVQPIDSRVPVRLLDTLWHRWRFPPIELWTGAIDIAHSPSPMPVPSHAGCSVITVHDCYFMRHPEDVIGPVARDYVPLARRGVADADAVITVSETTRQDVIATLGADPERVYVTHLGVDADYCAPPPPAPERAVRLAGLGVRRPYLLFVGTREPRKDLPTLLRGFDSLAREEPDVDLVLVGSPGHRWEETWARTTELVRSRTTVLPHQGTGALIDLYADSVALLLPSRWEGFGLTAVEAMALGTPVIAARAGSLPEILGSAATWIEVGDADALASACARLIHDEELRRDRGALGRRHVERYRWSETAAATRRAYAEVAG